MRCEVRQWLTTRVCDGKTPVDGAFLAPAQGSSAIVVGFPMPQTFSELPVHHPKLHQLVTASDLGLRCTPGQNTEVLGHLITTAASRLWKQCAGSRSSPWSVSSASDKLTGPDQSQMPRGPCLALELLRLFLASQTTNLIGTCPKGSPEGPPGATQEHRTRNCLRALLALARKLQTITCCALRL